MDFLARPYRSQIRVFIDGQPQLYWVRWYWTDADAPELPVPHCWSSHLFPGYLEVDDGGPQEIDLLEYNPSPNNPGYAHQCYLGEPDWWATGNIPAGALANPPPIPPCCQSVGSAHILAPLPFGPLQLAGPVGMPPPGFEPFPFPLTVTEGTMHGAGTFLGPVVVPFVVVGGMRPGAQLQGVVAFGFGIPGFASARMRIPSTLPFPIGVVGLVNVSQRSQGPLPFTILNASRMGTPSGITLPVVLNFVCGGRIVPAQPTPTGTIVAFAGSAQIPTGYLECNGNVYQQSAYPNLYNIIGTLFGGSVGAGTFAVPNLNGRVPIGPGSLPSGATVVIGQTGGEDKHTMQPAELAAHVHASGGGAGTNYLVSGGTAFNVAWGAGASFEVAAVVQTQYTGNSVPFNVLSPYLGLRWLIAI
jgi:microcystin-dependent protein